MSTQRLHTLRKSMTRGLATSLVASEGHVATGLDRLGACRAVACTTVEYLQSPNEGLWAPYAGSKRSLAPVAILASADAISPADLKSERVVT